MKRFEGLHRFIIDETGSTVRPIGSCYTKADLEEMLSQMQSAPYKPTILDVLENGQWVRKEGAELEAYLSTLTGPSHGRETK